MNTGNNMQESEEKVLEEAVKNIKDNWVDSKNGDTLNALMNFSFAMSGITGIDLTYSGFGQYYKLFASLSFTNYYMRKEIEDLKVQVANLAELIADK